MVKKFFVFMFAIVISDTGIASVDLSDNVAVRLSASGICHPPSSAYYDRVKDTLEKREKEAEKSKLSKIDSDGPPFTLRNCIDRGFRLPNHLQVARDAQLAAKAALANAQAARIAVDKAEDANKELAIAAAVAAETTAIEEGARAKQVTENASGKNKDIGDKSQDFGGLRFGLGIGVAFLGPQIDTVTLVDDVIVVSEERSNQARVILESHSFHWNWSDDDTGRQWGVGPFIAASLGDDQGQGLLDAFGLGVMFGLRNSGSSRSYNVGLGWFVDTQVTQLRPGLSDGMTTTIADSSGLTREVDEEGLMILISGSW